MKNLRGSILLAWVFCIIISGAAIVSAIQTVTQELPSHQPFLLANDVVSALLPMLFAIPAALIISRQPRNLIGWLLMTLSLVSVPNDFMTSYLSAYKTAPPPTLLNLFMMLFTSFYWVALITPLLMIPLFFPTGRLLSPRWRWTVYLAAGACLYLLFWGVSIQAIQPTFAAWKFTNPIGFIPETFAQYFQGPFTAMLVVLTVTSLASIVVRYRRAAPVEREQMKWLLYACTVFVLVYLPSLLLIKSNLLDPAISSIILLLFSLVIIGFPAVITIAILRYHLFDIDVIIRLTLVYLILTGLLGLIYFGGVILLQQAFRALTGQTSDAAVVITTLAIAALFNTLRRRIQNIIDRRFFRQKYNAEKALDAFSVAARTNTDLNALTSMLIEITQEALQPTQVDLRLQKRK